MAIRPRLKRAPAAQGQPQVLALPPSMRLGDAGTLHDRMMHMAATAHQVRVEGAAVREIDTAGLQLLCAFAADVRRRGAELIWDHPAAVLCEGARRLGLAHMLGLPHSV